MVLSISYGMLQVAYQTPSMPSVLKSRGEFTSLARRISFFEVAHTQKIGSIEIESRISRFEISQVAAGARILSELNRKGKASLSNVVVSSRPSPGFSSRGGTKNQKGAGTF